MIIRNLISIFCFIGLLFLAGCGQEPADARRELVLEAQIHLSYKRCKEALEVLKTVTNGDEDALYLRTLSAAYACKAGYSTPQLVVTDLAKIGTPSALGGFTRFVTSTMSTPTSADFVNMQLAIDTLLYAGGLSRTTEPTAAERLNVFSAEEAADINMQLAFLLMAQIGNYLKFYGAADASGNKTQCITDYNTAGVQAYIATLNGGADNCDPLSDNGKAELGGFGNYNIQRHCQGIVLVNNLIEVFTDVAAFFGGAQLASITNVNALKSAARALLVVANPSAAAVADVLSQANCESDNASNEAYIELYFAYFLETLFE